jgi:hypothetical protein
MNEFQNEDPAVSKLISRWKEDGLSLTDLLDCITQLQSYCEDLGIRIKDLPEILGRPEVRRRLLEAHRELRRQKSKED